MVMASKEKLPVLAAFEQYCKIRNRYVEQPQSSPAISELPEELQAKLQAVIKRSGANGFMPMDKDELDELHHCIEQYIGYESSKNYSYADGPKNVVLFVNRQTHDIHIEQFW